MKFLFDGVNILGEKVDERVWAFLGYAIPIRNSRITNAEFLRAAMNAGKKEDEKISVRDFITKIGPENGTPQPEGKKMAGRYLNEGFSGGEKKRNEFCNC